MPISEKQIEDLERKTPPSLREPSPVQLDASAKAALLRWAGARGFNAAALEIHALESAGDDELFGYAVGGHVCIVALHVLELTMIEQRRTLAIMDADDRRKARVLATPGPRLHFFPTLERIDSNQKIIDGPCVAKELFDALNENARQQEALAAEREDILQAFEAQAEQLVVPIVASRYFCNQRRSAKVAQETVLLYQLTQAGIPLLRSIAMIGGLQNDRVPVDVGHPDLDRIFDRHTDNLAALHKALAESRGRSGIQELDRPLG